MFGLANFLHGFYDLSSSSLYSSLNPLSIPSVFGFLSFDSVHFTFFMSFCRSKGLVCFAGFNKTPNGKLLDFFAGLVREEEDGLKKQQNSDSMSGWKRSIKIERKKREGKWKNRRIHAGF